MVSEVTRAMIDGASKCVNVRSGDHGRICESVINAPGGDKIPAYQCVDCGLKVAKNGDHDGFELNPCSWVKNVVSTTDTEHGGDAGDE